MVWIMLLSFYLHGASDACVLAVIVCVRSVCVCVCVSVTRRYCIKLLNVGSRKQHANTRAQDADEPLCKI